MHDQISVHKAHGLTPPSAPKGDLRCLASPSFRYPMWFRTCKIIFRAPRGCLSLDLGQPAVRAHKPLANITVKPGALCLCSRAVATSVGLLFSVRHFLGATTGAVAIDFRNQAKIAGTLKVLRERKAKRFPARSQSSRATCSPVAESWHFQRYSSPRGAFCPPPREVLIELLGRVAIR